MKRAALFLAFAFIVALIIWNRRGADESALPGSSAAQSKIENQNSKIATPPIDATDLAASLNSPAHDIRADLQLVSTIIDTYRSNSPHEGNPTGTNAEITAALAGGNKFNLILIARNHAAINAAGELCDRWGTPFFFHAESGTRMEIRSAGPDRKLHTADDTVWNP